MIFLALVWSCSSHPGAQTIIDRAIEKHGGDLYERSNIEFAFRGISYTITQDGGLYQYTRTIRDSSNIIRDTLSNDGFTRTINGERKQLPESEKSSYANSLNSVVYFALLPHGLNDSAVIKEYLGTDTVQGEPYYEIHISFKKEGGGKDYEDTFVYWIHQKDYTMDYLAYEFHVGEGGIRFRDATNERVINGIRFADYHNYKSAEENVPLQNYDTLFEEGKLEKLSEINLEHISVSPVVSDG